MYPNTPPDFRNNAPGSAAWVVQEATGPRVYVSQWDVIVRAFQDKAKNRLLPPFYARNASGNCDQVSTAWRAWSDAWQGLAQSNPPIRQTGDLPIDGVLGAETADALWALLCMTHQTDRASQWAAAIQAGTMPIEFVRQMIWFAFYVNSINPDPNAAYPNFTQSVDGSNLSIPEPNIPPAPPNIVVVSAPADRTWVGSFRPGVDPFPVPPSQSGGLAAQPGGAGVLARVQAMRFNWWQTGLAMASAAGLTWLLTKPAHGYRENDGYRDNAHYDD